MFGKFPAECFRIDVAIFEIQKEALVVVGIKLLCCVGYADCLKLPDSLIKVNVDYDATHIKNNILNHYQSNE
jgi:hypothetical protein